MESFMIKTARFILGFGFLCAAMVCLQAIQLACQMVLELQEWVAVRGTPVVVWITFRKCRHK